MLKTPFIKVLFTILLFMIPTILKAQLKISGKVVQEADKPVDMAEIHLYKDSVAVKLNFSDEKGNFEIIAAAGIYRLQIRQMGTVLYNKNLTVDKDINLGTIQVVNTKNLQEVNIVSKKKLIERKVDRLIFNVEYSTAATGGTALDALSVTPRIKIQNEQVSMIGKKSMSAMVDGKIVLLTGDDLLNFLRSIPSDQIRSIEVITAPPAQYDAEGNSGMINIRLKKSKLNQWNAALRSSFIQSAKQTGSLGGSFDYQKNKLSFYTNLNYRDGSTAPVETSRIYYPSGSWNEETHRQAFQHSFNSRIGADYQFTKKWSLGVQYLGTKNRPGIEENSVTAIYNPAYTQIDSYINTVAQNKGKNSSNSFNLNSTVDLDTTGKKVVFNLDYFQFNNDDNRNFNSTGLISANNISAQEIENFSAKADVEHPLKWVTLGYGAKVSSIKTRNDVKYFETTSGVPVFDPLQSNRFNYRENTQSVYIKADKKINDTWETQLGMRIENTQTNGISESAEPSVKNNYTRFFPTFYLTYTPVERHVFAINYNKRINRPSYSRLNPFRWYNNPFSYTEGNPFLQPSFSDNIELNYTLDDNFSSSAYYSHTKNGFEQITIIDDQTNIQRTVAQNFFNTSVFGITESYTFTQLKWLSATLSFDWNYSRSKSLIPITNQNLDGANAYLSTSNDFILTRNKALLLNLSYWYNFKGTSDLDRNSAYSQFDAAIKYITPNKKFQVSLNATDILKSNTPVYTSYTNQIRIDYKNYYDIRSVRLSLSYSLGNKSVSVKKKEVGNAEEKERTN